MADYMTDGNIAGFNLDRAWIDEGEANTVTNMGNGTSYSIPATSGFIFANDTDAFNFSGVTVEPELFVKGKPVGEVLKNISSLLKFMIEKYDLHECKELKELVEIDQWADKVEIEKIPEFLKDEDFKL